MISKVSNLILIVDDEYVGQETLQSMLEGQGYQFEFAANGLQAIEKVKKLLPDVILLDVMMPGLTGFEVCKIITNDEEMKNIPIVILTALDDQESQSTAFANGASEFMVKPFDRYELKECLHNMLRGKRLGLYDVY